MSLKHKKSYYHAPLLALVQLFSGMTGLSSETPLNKDLLTDRKDNIPAVFRDMGVIQRRAMSKSGKFLLSTFGNFDFSDGPYTNYGLNINPGYAFSDFFEVYLNYAPAFLISPRSIVQIVSELELSNGKRAEIVAGRPQSQIGFDILWAPTYGKDSIGLKKIIRSDTFLKLGFAKVSYDAGDGNKFQLGVGKTYFLNSFLGLRVSMSLGYVQTIINDRKSYRGMALIDGGFVLYL